MKRSTLKWRTVILLFLSGLLVAACQSPGKPIGDPAEPPVIAEIAYVGHVWVGSVITVLGRYFSNTQSVTIGNVTCLPIKNTDDSLVFMVMPGSKSGILKITTPAGSVSTPNRIEIYLSVPPDAQHQNGDKLVGSDKMGRARQGSAVAIDGNSFVAVAGGPGDADSTGCVWVFSRTRVNPCSTTEWKQQGKKLVPSDGKRAAFGSSVAISADGSTIVVGGRTDNNGIGAVWIFGRVGDQWVQLGSKLTADDVKGQAAFGSSVSISADTKMLIVGGSGDNGYNGAAWIFERAGSNYVKKAKLTGEYEPRSNLAARMGASASISADATTVIVGAPFDAGLGSVLVYVQNQGQWQKQGKLTGDVTGTPQFGGSVGLTVDGNTVVVGSVSENNNMGATRVYKRTNGAWTQFGPVLFGSGSSTNTRPNQGSSVAISSDGNLIAIGGQADNSSVGAVWIFKRADDMSYQQNLLKITGTGYQGAPAFGCSVALSSDAMVLFTSGAYDDGNLGACWGFGYCPVNPGIPLAKL